MKLNTFLKRGICIFGVSVLNMAIATASPAPLTIDQAKEEVKKEATSTQVSEKLDASKNYSAEEKAFLDKWHVTGTEAIIYRRVFTPEELDAYKAANPDDKDFAQKKKTISFAEFNALAAKGKEFKFSKISGNGRVLFAQMNEDELKASQAERLSVKLKVGDVFPAFSLSDTQGRKVDNSIFKGKITLVNFMFDKCVPCIAEIPALNQFAEKHKEIQTLAMTFDDLEAAKTFSKEHKFTWPIIAGGFEVIIKDIGLTAFPGYFLIDADGKLISDGSKSPLRVDDEKVFEFLEKWVSSHIKSKAAP